MFDLNKNNWPEYQFSEIAKQISERIDPAESDAEIYVGLEHIEPHSIHIKEFGTPSDVKGTKLKVYKGDMIFGKRRAYQRKAAIADFDGICSAHAMVLRAKPKVMIPELFPFFLHSDAFMNRAIDISEGSLSPTIKWKILAKQKFTIPPLDDQKNLADLLWAGDEVVQKYQKLNNSLSRYYETNLKFIVNYPTNGNEVRIFDHINIKTGKLDANAADDNGKYPFFTCSRDSLRIDNWSFDQEAVLVAGNGELNVKYYSGKFDAYQRTYIIHSTSRKLLNKYLYYLFDSYIGFLRTRSRGGVIKYLRMDDFKQLIVNLTTVEEQLILIKKFEKIIHIKSTLKNENIVQNIINEIF